NILRPRQMGCSASGIGMTASRFAGGLMRSTSAPRSASNMAQNGAGPTLLSSTIRTPLKGPVMMPSLCDPADASPPGTLARYLVAGLTGKSSQYRARPIADHTLLEQPPAALLHDYIGVIPEHAHRERLLAGAIRDEAEGFGVSPLTASINQNLADMNLTPGKHRQFAKEFDHRANISDAHPTIYFLEYVFAKHGISGEAGHEAFGITRTQRPGITGIQFVNLQTIFGRQGIGLSHGILIISAPQATTARRTRPGETWRRGIAVVLITGTRSPPDRNNCYYYRLTGIAPKVQRSLAAIESRGAWVI